MSLKLGAEDISREIRADKDGAETETEIETMIETETEVDKEAEKETESQRQRQRPKMRLKLRQRQTGNFEVILRRTCSGRSNPFSEQRDTFLLCTSFSSFFLSFFFFLFFSLFFSFIAISLPLALTIGLLPSIYLQVQLGLTVAHVKRLSKIIPYREAALLQV